MKVLEFTPAAVGVRVGQRVVWTNHDTSPHNVTYVSGPKFKSSGTLHPGGRFSLKVTSPGTIHYFCTLHPWMKATIVVSP
jgi:plastocyanin